MSLLTQSSLGKHVIGTKKVCTQTKAKSVHTNKGKKCAHKKKGAQPGNKNGTGPPGNQNAKKHGLFAKWLPEEVNQIIGEMPESPLDILWYNIQLQLAAIVRAQNIMYVIDKDDRTRDPRKRCGQ